MPTVFLTGFPGFLGSALVERVLDRYDEPTTVTCLVQSDYRSEAEETVAGLDADADRVELVEGDLTEDRLGLDGETYDDLQAETVEVFHLAAIYDFEMTRAAGEAVNVDGTRRMLDLAEGCGDLERFHHVSSVVVAGTYEGRFTEEMLLEGQRHINFYESSKFQSEVLVQQRMDDLPVTIYRPAAAVGDSETGETQKYDGIYYIVERLADMGSFAVVPTLYGAGSAELNTVPRDYVVDAIGYLSGIDESEGEVYHLADPDPPTTTEVIRVLGDAFGKSKTIPLPVIPAGLLQGVIDSLAGVSEEAEGLSRGQGLKYFVWPPSFDCSKTLEHLEGSGVECPAFEDYAENLVTFYQDNPHIGEEGMH